MNGGEFAQAAVRLAGFAGVVLGWRPGEFWAATPAELGAVADAMRGEGGEALSAQQLAELKTKFPDEGELNTRHREERSDVAIQFGGGGGHEAGLPRFARNDDEGIRNGR